VQTVAHARLAASWLRQNRATFIENIVEPNVLSEEEAREWAKRLMPEDCVPRIEHDETLARMRDRSLNFHSPADLTLFLKLVNDDQQLHTYACLRRSEYTDNNVGN